MIFRQLFDRETCTYTYLLADEKTKEAILIDPVDTQVERDTQLIQELGLTLKYGLNTHVHADHITGTAKLKDIFPEAKSVLSANSGGRADIQLSEGDRVSFGSRYLEGKNTPGHTEGCMSYVLDDRTMVFTGDTLFVRGCGRTDFQGGSASSLYSSVHSQIFSLPESCAIYPGHDYRGRTRSTVAEEKAFNPRLGGGKTQAQFEEIMAALNLADPKKIHIAVPANMRCGYPEDVVPLE